MPSSISGMSFDCFSQIDLHIAPITMHTEGAPQAIRTVIHGLLYSLHAAFRPSAGVPLHGYGLKMLRPPSENHRVYLENKGWLRLFPPWSVFFIFVGP